MNPDAIARQWRSMFSYSPTPGQEKLITMFSRYVSGDISRSLFMLKGYAGTGKTSIVSALVTILPRISLQPLLLAPTGRAAKVMTGYSNKTAYTIHKKIYRLLRDGENGTVLQPGYNHHQDTVFIVDEASMIPGQSSSGSNSLFGSHNLLEDLVRYVYSGKNCSLLLIGDMAQLPPVGSVLSPALDKDLLRSKFNLTILEHELTEVVRQEKGSAILDNATRIRQSILKQKINLPVFRIPPGSDLRSITGEALEEELNNCYSLFGHEHTILICRSNKRANIFNQAIRNRMLFRENEIDAGDIMMVVRNNYYWLGDDDSQGFIANGDMIEILNVIRTEAFDDFRFADISFRWVDYPGKPTLDAKILLNSIGSEHASMPSEEQRKLGFFALEGAPGTSRKKKMDTLRNDPYYNALQVKFAYALTCHKSQGGQWDAVFVDQGYITRDRIDAEYFRWLYTALTRAKQRLYLVNFHAMFFEKVTR